MNNRYIFFIFPLTEVKKGASKVTTGGGALLAHMWCEPVKHKCDIHVILIVSVKFFTEIM